MKIMIARYRFIGDTILSIPFLKALREVYPAAEIHYLVGKDAHDLMQLCPYIDKAICFEPRELGFWNAIQQIKKEKYNTAYLLKRSFSSALITALAGVPERIGFDTEHRGLLLTKRISYREHMQHEAQCFLDLLPTSCELNTIHLESWLPEAVYTTIQPWILVTSGSKIVLHATSTNPAKCWPLRHFATLAKQLLSTSNTTLYAMGTTNESVSYETIRETLPAQLKDRLVNLCGKTTLVESMALLRHMDLVVANDSGMIHMAAAMQTPVIALFGPSDPQQWFPLSDKAMVMTHPNMCLADIMPEQVFEQCKTSLAFLSGIRS